MLYKQKDKKIFIAVPKTATTAIESELCKDNGTLRNIINTEMGNTFVHKHISLAEIVNILGDSSNSYQYFAFIRHPVSECISKYYFYKTGRAYIRSKTSPGLGRKFRVLYAKIMPLWLWALTYPFKKSIDFINLDKNNKKVSNINIYNFDNFENEFERFCIDWGHPHMPLKKINVGSYNKIYAFNLQFLKFVFRRDIRRYNQC